MKKLFLVSIFALSAIVVFSQAGSQAVSGIKYRVNDTTSYQSSAATAHAQGYSDIYYNNQAVRPHFDIWNGSSYTHVFDFTGGGGAALTDGNGTTANGSAVDLGGTASENIVINVATGKYAQIQSIDGGSISVNENVSAAGNSISLSSGTAAGFEFNSTSTGSAVFSLPSGSLDVAGGTTGSGKLKIIEDADLGGQYSAFKVGSQSGNVDYTLPTAAPASNGQVLASQTDGTMSWITPNASGVTSVGLTLGTSGSDVNVSGSPITSSGSFTLNVPDAGSGVRGVVSTGAQTFNGTKTFSSTISGSINGSAGSANTWTTARHLSIIGDLAYTSSDFDGSGNASGTGTLATVNSNVGTFGSATLAPILIVNGKGLVTSVSTATITPAVGSITGLGSGVSSFLATPSSANLATALTDEVGSSGGFTRSDYVDAKVVDGINAGATTSASSQDAVFNALALKLERASAANTQSGNYTLTTADFSTNTTLYLTGSGQVITFPANATAAIPAGVPLGIKRDGATAASYSPAGGVTFGTVTSGANADAGLGQLHYVWKKPGTINTWEIFNGGLALGTANQILGVNNAGTASEYKTARNGVNAISGFLEFGGSVISTRTLTANIPTAFVFTGSYTTTANNQSSMTIGGGTTTTRSTASDVTNHMLVNQTFVAGGDNQVFNEINIDMPVLTGTGISAVGNPLRTGYNGTDNLIINNAANLLFGNVSGQATFGMTNSTGGQLQGGRTITSRGVGNWTSSSTVSHLFHSRSVSSATGGPYTAVLFDSPDTYHFNVASGTVTYTNFRVNTKLNVTGGTNTVYVMDITPSETSIVGLSNLYGFVNGSTTAKNGFGTVVPTERMDVNGNTRTNHIIGRTSAPSIAAGSGAGTSPTVSLSNATDMSGLINVTTGTIPTASAAVVTVTFNTAYGQAPNVIIYPANAATALLSGVSMVYATSTTTTFVITAGTSGLTAATDYKWFYHVIQ
jgi:hypothetical protein